MMDIANDSYDIHYMSIKINIYKTSGMKIFKNSKILYILYIVGFSVS